jgi:uncharacterized protein with ACT and thioredoxin-like domain
MKQIFSKIAKIGEGVRSMKVELSSISEMTQVAAKAEQLANQAIPLVKIFNEISFAVDKAERLIAESNKLYREGSVKGTEFASKVEDLGFNPRQTKEYTNMFDAMNSMAQRIGGLESLAKKHR